MQWNARQAHSLSSLGIGALLGLCPPFAAGQTPPDTRLEMADYQIHIYEPPSHHAPGFLSHFVHDTPEVIVGAPYSGAGTTRSVFRHPMFERPGTETITVRYFRDSRGRTRMEEVVTSAGALRDFGATIRIDDPVRGEHYRLNTKDKTVYALPFVNAAGAVVQRPVNPPPPVAVALRQFLSELGGDTVRAPGQPVSKTVPLGTKVIDGVRAVGTRLEHSIPGKEHPIEVISEQWFSPELGVVMANTWSLTVSSALSLESTYRLDIVPGEPDPALFAVPADYTRLELPPSGEVQMPRP